MTERREIKFIACDVDGTLLSNRAVEVTQRTVNAVRGVREKGVRFSLVSGRVLPSVVRFARQVGIDGAVAGLNGGAIGASVEDLVRVEALVREEVADVISEAAAFPVMPSVFCESAILVPAGDGMVRQRLASFGHQQDFIDVEDLRKPAGGLLPVRVHFIGEARAVEDLMDRVDFLWPGRYGFFAYSSARRDLWHLEMARPGYDKGTAVDVLISQYGIDRRDVMAIGDWINDVDMFCRAGVSVAMRNAIPPVREAADVVTELPCAEDGLAQFLESYFLSGA